MRALFCKNIGETITRVSHCLSEIYMQFKVKNFWVINTHTFEVTQFIDERYDHICNTFVEYCATAFNNAENRNINIQQHQEVLEGQRANGFQFYF